MICAVNPIKFKLATVLNTGTWIIREKILYYSKKFILQVDKLETT